MSVGLLARILVWTVTKKGHLWVLLLSSCFTFPNTEEAVFGAKTRSLSRSSCSHGPGSVFSLYSGGVSGEVGSTREPQSKWQWVMCCFAPAASLSWETSRLFTWGMGYSSEQGRAMKVWSSSLLGFLWCIEPFAGHPVAAGLARVGVIPPFRHNKPWGVRQRKCDPEIAEQKSALKAYPQFSKPEATSEAMSKYAAGKNYIKPETQKLILKSFLYFPEQFALK